MQQLALHSAAALPLREENGAEFENGTSRWLGETLACGRSCIDATYATFAHLYAVITDSRFSDKLSLERSGRGARREYQLLIRSAAHGVGEHGSGT